MYHDREDADHEAWHEIMSMLPCMNFVVAPLRLPMSCTLLEFAPHLHGEEIRLFQQFDNTSPGADPHEFAQDLDASDRNAFSEGHLLIR